LLVSVVTLLDPALRICDFFSSRAQMALSDFGPARACMRIAHHKLQAGAVDQPSNPHYCLSIHQACCNIYFYALTLSHLSVSKAHATKAAQHKVLIKGE
jgi:hypothetical protein